MVFFDPTKPNPSKYYLRAQCVPKREHQTDFTFTNINWLMLFKKIIAVYSEIHTKPIVFKG
jgi:hypothetical protein